MSILAGEIKALSTGVIEGIPENLFGADLLSGSVTKGIDTESFSRLKAPICRGAGILVKFEQTSSALGAITKAAGVDEFKSAFDKVGGNKGRNSGGQGR